MKATMQKVFGRVVRPPTPAPTIPKPPDISMPQPHMQTPFILDPQRFDNWGDSMMIQYGNPNERPTSESSYVLIDADFESLQEFGLTGGAISRQDRPSVTLPLSNQSNGRILRRSARLAPATWSNVYQRSTHPGTSSNPQGNPTRDSIPSISEPSLSDHANPVVPENVKANWVSKGRPPRAPSIASIISDTDDLPTPAPMAPLPRSIPQRPTKTKRIPFAMLNKPLPAPPIDDTPTAGDEICPYIVPEDEQSVGSNHDPPPEYVITTDIQQDDAASVSSSASSSVLTTSGDTASIKRDDPDLTSRLSRRTISFPSFKGDLHADGSKGKSRASSANRSHRSTASVLAQLQNLENSPNGSTHEIEEAPPPSSSKGKGRAASPIADENRRSVTSALLEMENYENSTNNNSTCGICAEEFRKVYNPIEASLKASGSSNPILYGLALSCPSEHEYCLSCMTSWLRTKLEGNDGAPVFPIRCPECPRTVPWEMDDETAVMVLGKDLLDAWFFKRLVASLAIFYCPNPKCSAPISEEVDDPGLTQVECPSCQTDMCYHCRTLWHPDVTCEYNQNPKSLEGEAMLRQLAEQQQWRRCPRCRQLVERTEGCRHMTCRCGFQYCHFCGSPWRGGQCSRTGQCTEWIADKTWKLGEKVEEVTTILRSPSPSPPPSWGTPTHVISPFHHPVRLIEPASPYSIVMPSPLPVVVPNRRGHHFNDQETVILERSLRTRSSNGSMRNPDSPMIQYMPLPSPYNPGHPTIIQQPSGWENAPHHQRTPSWASESPPRRPSPPLPSYGYGPYSPVMYPQHLRIPGVSVYNPGDEDERRRRHEERRRHPAFYSPENPPAVIRITGDEGDRLRRDRANQPAWHYVRPHSPRSPPRVIHERSNEDVRAWVSSVHSASPPPTVIQIPPHHQFPIPPAPTQSQPRPLSAAELETELTTSYSRQHHARGGYADQPGASAYKPAVAPIPPRPPRTLVRPMREQPVATQPQPSRRLVRPDRPIAAPPLPGHHRSKSDPPTIFEPKLTWIRDHIRGEEDRHYGHHGFVRRDAERRHHWEDVGVPGPSRPAHAPPSGRQVGWEQPAVVRFPSLSRTPTYLSDHQTTAFTGQADAYRGGRGHSAERRRNEDLAAREGRGPRRHKRPPLSTSAHHHQQHSTQTSTTPNIPNYIWDHSQLHRTATNASGGAVEQKTETAGSTSSVKRGRSLRERLVSLVKRAPSQEAAWKLERERGLAEGPASACLGRSFSRGHGDDRPTVSAGRDRSQPPDHRLQYYA
ncbi:hypothetical protein FRB94_014256 [Tulasnella sp. JGI-2019a]|nr:hypothetical protein FRB93_005393 [Tulasnella sp. JGI-2019a]KAG9014163.1 hypothetical protein FRB94_014256 [Tulasnella sp. JGI-2019a]